MKRVILMLCILWALAFNTSAQKPFDLKTGDILFQTNRAATSFVSAITSVSTSLDDLNFSHVGIALVEKDSIFVLEAIPTGVSKTPIDKFFVQSKNVDGNPLVIVGRLKPRFRKSIPAAIAFAESKLGKRYDFVFLPDNDWYYCSELIFLAFNRRNGKPVFDSQPMSFKDKSTGKTNLYWIEHFQRHNTEIPEGVEGTHPGDMSKSRAIKIVHYYF